MSRGHRPGHYSSADETLAMLALGEGVSYATDAELNGASIGPSQAVAFNAATGAIPRVSGKFLVIGTASGSDTAVSTKISYSLVKNGATSLGSTLGSFGSLIGSVSSNDAGLAGDFLGTVSWIDSGNALGATVKYGVAAQGGSTGGTGGTGPALLTLPVNASEISIVEVG